MSRWIDPWADRRDHPVTEPRHIGNVGWLPGVVSERAPQRRDGLVHGIRCDHDAGPDSVEQLIDADDLAAALREVLQQAHHSSVDSNRLAVARNLPGRRVHTPGADTQQGNGHRTIHALTLDCSEVIRVIQALNQDFQFAAIQIAADRPSIQEFQ